MIMKTDAERELQQLKENEWDLEEQIRREAKEDRAARLRTCNRCGHVPDRSTARLELNTFSNMIDIDSQLCQDCTVSFMSWYNEPTLNPKG
jgi:hypothetical protein